MHGSVPWSLPVPRILLTCCLCVLAALLSACEKPAPEAAVREAISRIEAGIAARNNADVRAELAASFSGGPAAAPNELDMAGAQRLMAATFLRYRNIGVVVTAVRIEPLAASPDQMWSSATVLLPGAAGLVPEAGRLHEVEGVWLREEGAWRLRQLTWR